MARFANRVVTQIALVCTICLALDRYVVLGVYDMVDQFDGHEFAEGVENCNLCGSVQGYERHYWHLSNEHFTTEELFGDRQGLNWTPEGLANIYGLEAINAIA